VSGQQRNLEGATRDILQVDKSVSEWGIINTKYGNKYSPMCAVLLPIIAQCIWWGEVRCASRAAGWGRCVEGVL